MKKAEEVMEILEAFDLTGSLRAAAELCGCDHKTVAHWVAVRDAAGGGLLAETEAAPAERRESARVESRQERRAGLRLRLHLSSRAMRERWPGS